MDSYSKGTRLMVMNKRGASKRHFDAKVSPRYQGIYVRENSVIMYFVK